MAYAEPAYQLDARAEYAPQRAPERGIHAVRGQRSSEAAPSSPLIMLAKMAAVIIAVAAILSFARIALTNATVHTLIENDSLSTLISESRSTGTSFEMEQSVLTSPSALNSAAKRLGMGNPAAVGTIALDPDVVATDDAGNLSLSNTLKNVVGSQE